MGTVNTVLFPSADAPTAQTTLYTTPAGTVTLIDKVTGTNTTGAPVTVAFHLVASGGTAGATNLIATKQIAAAGVYAFPELIGHVLTAGQFISAISGAAGVTIRGSGRQVS